MRKLVINTIIKNYRNGYDEITPMRYIRYDSNMHQKFRDLSLKRELIVIKFLDGGRARGIDILNLVNQKISKEEIYNLLKDLSNKILLECFRWQHCQIFR